MISVILPTYKEAENIVPMCTEVLRYLGPADEVLVVDDNSPDGTYAIAKDAFVGDPRVRPINRLVQKGCLTDAMEEGIRQSKGDFIIWMDSDLSQPPSKIPEMMARLKEGTDIVVASRYVPGGRDARTTGYRPVVLVQMFLSWALFRLTRAILKSDFRDWSSGYLACRRPGLLTLLPLKGDYGEYFMDLIYRAIRSGLKVEEIPYTLVVRQKGHSKTATDLWGLLKRGRKYLYRLVALRIGY